MSTDKSQTTLRSVRAGYSMTVVLIIAVIVVVLGYLGAQKAFDSAIETGNKNDESGTGAAVKGFVNDGIEGFQAANAKNRADKQLSQAVLQGDAVGVSFTLASGANPNLRYPSGYSYTLLHKATGRGYTQICQLLLNRGADVNATDASAATALHIAAETARYEIAELLINNQANINTQDNDGNTPLSIAMQSLKAAKAEDKNKAEKYEKIIDLLRQCGAEI